jgi:hypothetical protein
VHKSAFLAGAARERRETTGRSTPAGSDSRLIEKCRHATQIQQRRVSGAEVDLGETASADGAGHCLTLPR